MRIDSMTLRQYLKNRTYLYFQPISLLASFSRKAVTHKGSGKYVRQLSVFPDHIIGFIPNDFELINFSSGLRQQPNLQAGYTNSFCVLSSAELVFLQREVCNG